MTWTPSSLSMACSRATRTTYGVAHHECMCINVRLHSVCCSSRFLPCLSNCLPFFFQYLQQMLKDPNFDGTVIPAPNNYAKNCKVLIENGGCLTSYLILFMDAIMYHRRSGRHRAAEVRGLVQGRDGRAGHRLAVQQPLADQARFRARPRRAVDGCVVLYSRINAPYSPQCRAGADTTQCMQRM